MQSYHALRVERYIGMICVYMLMKDAGLVGEHELVVPSISVETLHKDLSCRSPVLSIGLGKQRSVTCNLQLSSTYSWRW